jgi:hypothetical protein
VETKHGFRNVTRIGFDIATGLCPTAVDADPEIRPNGELT